MANRRLQEAAEERGDTLKERRVDPPPAEGGGGGGIGGLLSMILSLLGGGGGEAGGTYTGPGGAGGYTGAPRIFGQTTPPNSLANVSGRSSGIVAPDALAGGKDIPWAILVPALLSVFGGLFEKKDDPLSDAMEQMGIMNRLGIQQPYQSPYLPQMGEAAFRAAMNQLQQTSGWGWPADRQPAGGTDWIRQMLANAPTGTPLEQRIARRTG